MNVLEEPVLVLNKNWEYIAVANAMEVMKDLYTGVITAIDPEMFTMHTFFDWVERGVRPGKPFVQAPKFQVEVPEIIVLANFDKVPHRSLHYSKQHIFKRDRYTCQYCGVQPGREDLTIDHIVPRSQGGQTNWMNCVTSCEDCNATKADRTPKQAGIRLRKQPVKPEWSIQQAVRRLAAERKPSWNPFIGKAAFA